MDDDVASALAEAFPGREVPDVESMGPSWNPGNETVRVDFADGETVYLKRATDGTRRRIVRERAVIEYVAENADVPVPRVAACDPDAAVPYLATRPVDGEGLLSLWLDADRAEQVRLARGVGRSLAAVHECRFPAHGQVSGGRAGDLELDTGPWTDVLRERIEELRALSPAERFDRHFDAVAAAVEANRDLLDGAPAALVHGDPCLPNCFGAERAGRGTEAGGGTAAGTRDAGDGADDAADGPVGFLDWEIAHVGDPARDLYRARTQVVDAGREEGPAELATALYEGYRERAGGLPAGFDERRPVYRAVRHLSFSGFFENWLDHVDQSPDEFAAWVDAEMERLLDAVE